MFLFLGPRHVSFSSRSRPWPLSLPLSLGVPLWSFRHEVKTHPKCFHFPLSAIVPPSPDRPHYFQLPPSVLGDRRKSSIFSPVIITLADAGNRSCGFHAHN